MRSGWLTSGPRVRAFEEEFAAALGDDVVAVALNSATAGLHLALEAIGVGPGDEVLVPTWTFTATAEVVRYLGADPIIVDIDERTLNLDLVAAEAAVTPRTRAMIPVHFAGLPVSRRGLEQFASRHQLAVVEDAAHAFTAVAEGSPIGGGASDGVVFSFYATKTMTTGEGGMLVTANLDLAARVRTMRLHGISRDIFDRYQSRSPSWHYDVVAPGYKYNLTDPAAAMGRVQLRRAQAMRARREQIATRYLAELSSSPLDLPATAGPTDIHAWHLFVVRIRWEASVGRDVLIDRLAAAGIGCSVHFIPLHKHPYWRDRYELQDAQFPVASREYERVISLPIYSAMTDDQVDRVIGSVTEALN